MGSEHHEDVGKRLEAVGEGIQACGGLMTTCGCIIMLGVLAFVTVAWRL